MAADEDKIRRLSRRLSTLEKKVAAMGGEGLGGEVLAEDGNVALVKNTIYSPVTSPYTIIDGDGERHDYKRLSEAERVFKLLAQGKQKKGGGEIA